MNQALQKNGYSIIVGMGTTGYSVARYLAAKGRQFVVFDTRNDLALGERFSRLNSDIDLYFQDLPDQVIENAKDLIVSPGVSIKAPFVIKAKRLKKPVFGDIQLFLRDSSHPVIGITGSNGKSTLTTLVGLALTEAGFKPGVGGNIGIPALDLLSEEHDVYVLELSSFQLETLLAPSFDVACLMNVSEDHMDRYDSFSHYKAAKHEIFRGAKKIVFNDDDPNTQPDARWTIDRVGFGFCRGALAKEQRYQYDLTDGFIKYGPRSIMHREEVVLQGDHNIKNALALFAIGKQFGLSEHHCAEVLREFTGLPHRCELVARKRGISYINDSKATNVGACVAALEGLANDYKSITLIAGGEGKGADFSDLTSAIGRYVKHVVLIGKDREKIAQVIPADVEYRQADSLPQAVRMASEVTASGAAVLLSPACASMDMFKNFEERGVMFAQAVEDLA